MTERLMVIMAHPDDAEIWAGGTLLNHKARHHEVLLYCIQDCGHVRRSEAEHGAEKLNAKIVFGEGINKETSLFSAVEKFRPTIVITHWEGDSHPEHVDVANLVNKLAPSLRIDHGLEILLYACDCYNSVGKEGYGLFIPTDVIDITDSWNDKKELIATHKSQSVGYWIEMIGRQNMIHGARVGVSFAEGFIQIPVLGVKKGSSKELLRGIC